MEIGKPKRNYFSLKYFKELIVKLFPFILMGIIIQIYMNIDKILVEHRGTTYELGIYSQMVKSFNVFLAPITAIGTILMPHISNLKSDSNKEDQVNIVSMSSNFIIILGIAIFFGLNAIAKQFIPIFFGESFLKYIYLFQLGTLLIITGSLSNIVVQQIIYPNKKEMDYNISLIIAAIIKVLLILALIPYLGIYSALIAYISSEIFILIWCIYRTRNILDVVPLVINLNTMKVIFSGLLMYITVFFLNLGLLF
ncbi:polysaccharide biosynthesis C-terminal domain-containing protein, partial [Neobacillus niacini]|uniref:lipopolysaccharide biosynthesis protein n=1 Tax=Neobacillus niacini TaxID=86668 RepID=UPI0030004D9B